MDSPFPTDLESTLTLFADLDLIDRSGSKKNMDEMDTEVLEVPDTPDRLAMVHSFDRSSGPSLGEKRIEGEADTRKTYARCRKVSGIHEVVGSSTALNDTDPLIRRARLAPLFSKTFETNASPQDPCTEFEFEKTRVSDDSGKSVEVVDLSQKSPFPFTVPTRCRDPRRNNVKASFHKSERSKSGRFAELLNTVSSFPDRSIGKSKSGIGILCDGESAALRSRDKGKGINLKSDPEANTEQVPSRPLQLDVSQRKMDRRRLVSNNYFSPCNTSKSKFQSKPDDEDIIKSVDGETSSDLISDLQAKAKQAISRPQRLTECNNGARRLMPNGCTSPYNTVHDTNVVIDEVNVVIDEVMKTPVGLVDGTSSRQINIVSLDSEGCHDDKKKGKVKFDANAVGNVQHVKAKAPLTRVCSTSGKDATVVGDIDDGTLVSSEDFGWRTTRNCKEKASMYSSHEIGGLSKREGTRNYLPDQSHEASTEERGFINLVRDSPERTISRPSPGQVSSESESESESRRHYSRQKFVKGKRRCSSLHESSSSSFEDSELSFLYSSSGRQSKSTRTLNSRSHETSLGPVIEVDELHSPGLRCLSAQEQSCRPDDSSAKTRQVESDEVLARQLQEQFYGESEGLGGTEEMDATIARSLQEEDARLAASIRIRGRSHNRDTWISHLYAHYPQISFQVPTSSRVPQLRRNFNSPEMDMETAMLAHLRRNFNNAGMDADTRHNFLEALEAAFDNDNDMAFSDYVLQTQRDFNENDYEMLLALDDNNHQHVGASENQINSLPQSVVQSESIREECVVCLETPIVGDIIRHLPCLHKFHKECIDTWLRRRTSCPICKSGISP